MKRAILIVMLAAFAAPLFAQSHEMGFLVGGSRRYVDNGTESEDAHSTTNFSFSNTSFDLFWGFQVDPDTWVKFKAGRIESPIAFPDAGNPDARHDVDGEVQHIGVDVEYRFSEAYGSTGLFAGAGLYRQSAKGEESTQNYGFSMGVNGDFPLSKRYGVILEAAYHWNRTDFSPRYLTGSAGLRVRF